jgi:hypothetical protein
MMKTKTKIYTMRNVQEMMIRNDVPFEAFFVFPKGDKIWLTFYVHPRVSQETIDSAKPHMVNTNVHVNEELWPMLDL